LQTYSTYQKNLIFDKIFSPALHREVTFELFLPLSYSKNKSYSVLMINDGQDNVAMKMNELIYNWQKNKLAEKFIVATIYAGDRIQEYGVARKSDYAKRGAKALLYNQFIINEFLPFLETEFKVNRFADDNAFAGYSLGGLSAFDIVWNNPTIFKKCGVFSGSFWWRKKALDKGYTEADRIAHQMIKKDAHKPGLSFWLQCGTKDERSDRNGNGIIDAIDDTLDLIVELAQKGYRPYDDVVYVEVKDGEHNQKTWSKIMPEFLNWLID
jgi:predicted alpha/beta superfamily hydrolase